MFLQSLIMRAKKVTHVTKIFGGLTREFWVGHLLVVGSTVLGVYLAAHSGLKTAIEYEAISSDKNNYYLRASLRDEIKYNIAITEKIIKTIRKIGSFDRRNYPKYQTYVLETMKQQPNTLKTPNIILSGTLQYYEIINHHIDRRERRLIGYPDLADNLQDSVDDYKKNVLSVLDKNLEVLEQRLKDHDVLISN